MTTGILISLCLFVPGLAWIRFCGERFNPPQCGWRASVVNAAGCLVIGLLWNTLFAGLLIEIGRFSRGAMLMGALTVSVAGLRLGAHRARHVWLSSIRSVTPSLILFALVAGLISIMPPRGEWLAGGWDPGVYTNQGIYAAQQGGRYNPASPVFEDVAGMSYNPFVERIAGRDEMFPGFPMDPESGCLQLTFYPLTPAWVAFLYSLGGMDAALRAMLYLALILALALTGALFSLGLPPRITLPATILMLAHPLTIYHSRTPCSEMLETVWVVTLGFCLAANKRGDKMVVAPFMPLILLAGILNRPTFLIWSTLLALILAVTGRLHTRRLAALSLAILLGMTYYWTRDQTSLDHIANWFPWLVLATSSGLTLAALLMELRRRYRWRLMEPLAFVLTPLICLALTVFVNPNGIHELKINLLKIAPYLGCPLILFASLGLLISMHRIWRTSEFAPSDMLLWLGLCAGMIPLAMKFSAELYPWATKRFLSSLPLALCLTTALCLAAVTDWLATKGKRLNYAPIVIGLCVMLVAQANRIRDAWHHTEYTGLAGRLAEISSTVDPKDVLLVDHFVWATPLTMAFGRQAINGEPLWERESCTRTAKTLYFLGSQMNLGRRIFILTSTQQGITVFPPAFHSIILRSSFDPYDYHIIDHHRDRNGFPQRKRRAIFRLYEFSLPAPHDPDLEDTT